MQPKRLDDVAATEACGARLATALGHEGAVIALQGPLGSGKTTLVRGFLRALGHAGPVRSPTYTLVEPYELAGRRVLHVDLYRIAAADEVEFLGLREQAEPATVLLIEWPERGGGHLPPVDVELHLAYLSDARSVRGLAHGERGRRQLAALFPSD